MNLFWELLLYMVDDRALCDTHWSPVIEHAEKVVLKAMLNQSQMRCWPT